MKKITLYRIALSIVTVPVLGWQETRTPLSLYQGYLHYPLDRDRKLNSFGIDPHFWSGIYFRSATKGYRDTSCDTINSPRSSKESMATLYFGKSPFTLADSFPNSTIPAGTSPNPLIDVIPITLNFDYRERGVWFGATVSTRFGDNDHWNTGLRVRVPYRDIQVQSKGNTFGAGSGSSSTIAGLFQQREEAILVGAGPVQAQKVFAARLDLLTALNIIDFNIDGSAAPLVTFGATDIAIAGQDVSGGVPSAGPLTTTAPFLSVIQSNNGTVPTSVRWADVPANGSTVVAGDGSGLSNLARGRIAHDIDYAALSGDKVAQSHLYVVPNVGGVGSGVGTQGIVLPAAQTVFTNIAKSISSVAEETVSDSIDQFGLNFAYGDTRGMGDTDMELFLAYDAPGKGYAEGRFGVIAPTGIKVRNPLNVLQNPTGNNGHPEVRIASAFGCDYITYLKFNADFAYSWVVKAGNNIAAPFEGATVKNIGPCVRAHTWWQYFVGNLNMTLVNPYNNSMGLMLGYEAYVKSKDHVELACNNAQDFLGTCAPLDPCVFTKATDRVAHKIRLETFLDDERYNIFLGFTAVVAGKNIANDTDFHIGLDIYF